MYELKLKINNTEKAVGFNKPTALKDLLINNYLDFIFPCAGKGICGKCKIKIMGDVSELNNIEKKHLTEEEISEGWRLACQVKLNGDAIAYIDKNEDNCDEDEDVLLGEYSLIVDIGTTTLCVSLQDLKTFKTVKEIQILNPQIQFGADVISRIDYAINVDNKRIRRCLINKINDIIFGLNLQSIEQIKQAIITGNTAMLYLLTGIDTTCLSRAPFVLTEKFGKFMKSSDLGLTLSEKCRIYIPPCISAFVGADLTCAILSSGILDKKVALLVDAGTNGEIILKNNDKICCCSTSIGPVFEGIGISKGMMAQDGAIEKVYLKNGMIQLGVIGKGAPKGICGSGIIDAIALLKKLGIVDDSGKIKDVGPVYSGKINEEKEVELFENIEIKQEDIRNLQMAKAAIYAGINTIIKENEVSFDDIEVLFIAGGFGEHIDLKNASEIKMIPKKLVSKTVAIGNAALKGAQMIAENFEENKKFESISEKVVTISLPDNDYFKENYIKSIDF